MMREPQREQKAAFAAASNPHCGHLIAIRFPHAVAGLLPREKTVAIMDKRSRTVNSARRYARQTFIIGPFRRWPPAAPSW
jgi:hypothetical protein